MAVSSAAYRLTDPVMAVVCKDDRERLECLNPGAILITTSQADSAGMIQASCEGLTVLIFRRDIEERSVEITLTDSPSIVNRDCQSERVAPPLSWQLANGGRV
jgi:hypothetical protein